MAELTIRFDIRVGAGTLRFALAAGLLTFTASELASESVVLTTYYPAPSGVYTQMITTGNSYLARDGGGVSVGNNNGVAASRPLSVTETMGFVNNTTLRTATDGTQLGLEGGGVNFQAWNFEAGYLRFGTSNTERMRVNALGNVGVGTPSPVSRLDVVGDLTVRPPAACTEVSYDYSSVAGGTIVLCPAGQYVTTIEGFYTRKYVAGVAGMSSDPDVKMALCCPCPAGGCIPL